MPVVNSDIAHNLEKLADLHSTGELGFMRLRSIKRGAAGSSRRTF